MLTPVLLATFVLLLAYRAGTLHNLAGAINGTLTVGGH